jgi:hypothetical protein
MAKSAKTPNADWSVCMTGLPRIPQSRVGSCRSAA